MAKLPTFRQRLKEYREAVGLTQEELAIKLHVSFQTISAWERQLRYPAKADLVRIARVLDIPENELRASITYSRTGKAPEGEVGVGREGLLSGLDTWGELQRIYRTRTDFNRDWSYLKMFESAQQVIAAGISLNAVALNFGRDHLLESLLDREAHYQLCFLDPDGAQCRQREEEEGLSAGTLKDLTRLNLRHMEVIHKHLCLQYPTACHRLDVRTYDLAPRYNIYIADDQLMTVQSYGYGRGEDTPTFVLRRNAPTGLFDFYATIAHYILEHSTPVSSASLTVELHESRP